MRAREACSTAVMTAACLATNYALVGVPNVKLMNLLVFASGFLFGTKVGVSVAVLTWLIYGTLNPYGFCLPILLATAASETIYGLAGGLLRNSRGPGWLEEDGLAWSGYKLAVLGFSLTAAYDLLTNLAFSLTFGIPFLLALAYGAWFAIVHEVSNAALFAACTPALLRVSCLLGQSPGEWEVSKSGSQ